MTGPREKTLKKSYKLSKINSSSMVQIIAQTNIRGENYNYFLDISLFKACLINSTALNKMIECLEKHFHLEFFLSFPKLFLSYSLS